MHLFQLPVEEGLLCVMIRMEMDHGIGAVPGDLGFPAGL